jgi:hypothetical protein
MRKVVWENLRSELHFLKNCQVQYFFFSVTATGAVAGFGGSIGKLPGAPSVYLAPLLVILPCWWIFFDKATTISRIVAYLRHLEGAIRDEASCVQQCAHHGWESALAAYRKESSDPEKNPTKDYADGLEIGLSKSLLFQTTHKYWSINWWTFALLSSTCLWLAWLDTARADQWTIWLFLAISVISALHNLCMAGQLTDGTSSYEECYERWGEILSQLDSADCVSQRSPEAEELPDIVNMTTNQVTTAEDNRSH